MYVILHGDNVFCGYSPSGLLIWDKFSFENKTVRPSIFSSEVEAVGEGNSIQNNFQVTVLVVPIEHWINDNKK